MRVFDRSTSASELRPEHALLTPTWLAALVLLVANDHWLKGAGLLPGVLTGKLSDFAGMLVAPILLATLLRVDTRRGLLVCHLAVVTVFSGIQLSPQFADLWSTLMGLFGYPWVITCDPTDLIALPFAWLSWRVLTPAMDPERPALVGLRRSAVATVSVFGLWATVATSRDYDDGEHETAITLGETGGWDGSDTDEEWENVWGDVYIHNPNDFDISVTIRPLAFPTALDCQAIAQDPSRLLPDGAFGPAEHWLLPPTTNVAIEMAFECGAAKVGGEGIPEQIVFSTDFAFDSWSFNTFPGSHESLDELQPWGAAIVMDETGSSWAGGENWRHTPKTDTVPLPEHCMPEPTERRIDWSNLPNHPIVQVQSKTAGLDGCYEFELLPWTEAGYEWAFTWYLCAPESSVRLEPGSHYRLTSTTSPVHSVEATLVDPELFMPVVDEMGQPVFVARWVRGLADTASIQDIEAEAVIETTCPWEVTEGCSMVERKLGVSIDAGAIEAVPGVTTVFIDSLGRHEFTLGRARELALINGTCDMELPYEIDYALISEALSP